MPTQNKLVVDFAHGDRPNPTWTRRWWPGLDPGAIGDEVCPILAAVSLKWGVGLMKLPVSDGPHRQP
jgi:hypothetical protein